MTVYVCGFLFDKKANKVALIRKKRPKWQDGYLNGIGGKKELGECLLEAMQREFQEECEGLFVKDWDRYAILQSQDWVVHFFRAFNDKVIDSLESKVCSLLRVRAETETDLEVPIVTETKWFPFLKVIPNLRWLIPMALEKGLTGQPTYNIQETYGEEH